MGVTLLLVASGLWSPAVASGQDTPAYRNLQVLPQDISRADLTNIMLDNLSGLGLPRRANEGCLFCHAGSMEVPSREWDWASDENPMKLKARAMMAMVRDINETHLADIERTWEGEVGCNTCHSARTNPMPLTEVLLREYDAGGADALVRRYQDLRARYFAADAYDFRTHVLAEVASTIADRGRTDDAARVHQLNIDATEDPEANHGLIHLRMVQALEADGIDAMVATYHALESEHPVEAYSPLLIDRLAWNLFRSDRQEAGFRLFELNFAEHPDSYVATEDLAWGSESMGDHQRALSIAEAWVVRHPDHELGLRLLSDLRGG